MNSNAGGSDGSSGLPEKQICFILPSETVMRSWGGVGHYLNSPHFCHMTPETFPRFRVKKIVPSLPHPFPPTLSYPKQPSSARYLTGFMIIPGDRVLAGLAGMQRQSDGARAEPDLWVTYLCFSCSGCSCFPAVPMAPRAALELAWDGKFADKYCLLHNRGDSRKHVSHSIELPVPCSMNLMVTLYQLPSFPLTPLD